MRFRRYNNKRKVALHNRILLGLILGGAAGILSNSVLRSSPAFHEGFEWAVSSFVEPVGQVFLRLLFMIVIPLIFSSLTLGVAGIGDIRRLGRMGSLTFGYFVLVTVLATVLGLLLVNIFQPGGHLDPATRERLLLAFQSEAEEKLVITRGISVSDFLQIIPRNPVEAAARGDMLAVIFFSVVLGAGLTQIPRAKAEPVIGFLEGIAQTMAVIIHHTMRLAPFGVFALIFAVTARFGWDVLLQLFYYVAVVIAGLAIFQFGVYGLLVRFFCKANPGHFFRRIRDVMITAFSTSSSNATLPTTLKTAEEELGVPPEIAGFVLPLGATMNMNGTALFEGVTIVFLAQVFGVHLDLGQQLVVIVLSVASAIGTAGVPGGSIPLLAGVLGTVGVPPEGIALIIGVDRLLDMSRTVVNVSGDLTAALFVTGRENASRSISPPLT